jgi:hypothetical protein
MRMSRGITERRGFVSFLTLFRGWEQFSFTCLRLLFHTISFMMVSPRTHDLFGKAISESGFGRLLFNSICGNNAQAQSALG